MTRILLLGADGQLGTELRRSLSPLGDIVAATLSGRLGEDACEAADFSEPGSLQPLVERVAPDIVVNAAAHTAVDRAETERGLAFAINAEAPAVLATACAARGARLVHYSTDYVFDGSGTRPYREDDATSPLGVYGHSKRAGELAVLGSGARHLLFRTAWVYAAHSHNFLRTMLRVGAERDELRVVADQVGTPTPAALIADVTARALERADATRSGLWHLTPTGQTSWHGFAEAIFEGAVARGLLARRPKVEAITTADYPTPAARPAWSVLDCTALQRDFAIHLPDWREGLADTLDQLRA
ncbi:dTDP-4-dehydrorhamnose reductase [Luteimonas sp. 8-5]|uniref:dTDP-4-dehydrorhamnose reductase n=1 Tax=Luteimonas sp. 8-5 TaxID=3039387 RepID=UPI002436A49D|nr:dTDP-4-dehydrorhamnose reductase [Luteimonas sp. 8-5]MDG6347386.1 dTDP-4-dehydrorhamnose reductase [Luteimonas sp. 8-5]